MTNRKLLSVAQFCAQGPFTQNQLRWWIFQAELNGLAETGAIVRVQRRLYIDADLFDGWVEKQNRRHASAPAVKDAARRRAPDSTATSPAAPDKLPDASLRDRFAERALPAMIAIAHADPNGPWPESHDEVADACYQYANAMLKRRAEK